RRVGPDRDDRAADWRCRRRAHPADPRGDPRTRGRARRRRSAGHAPRRNRRAGARDARVHRRPQVCKRRRGGAVRRALHDRPRGTDGVCLGRGGRPCGCPPPHELPGVGERQGVIPPRQGRPPQPPDSRKITRRRVVALLVLLLLLGGLGWLAVAAIGGGNEASSQPPTTSSSTLVYRTVTRTTATGTVETVIAIPKPF